MTLGLLGATAMAPMNKVDCVSVLGVQVAPPSVVFQTPPPAAAIYTVLTFVGSAAMPVIRPETGWRPGTWPLPMGPGPSAVQLVVLRGKEVERRVRSSSTSRLRDRASRGRLLLWGR